jgi:protein PsiE
MNLRKKLPAAASMGNAVHLIENCFLLVIALFTVIAMAQEVHAIVMSLSVALKDLLLMFIYVEVLAMVGVYYDSKKIPITLPLYIAITALARLVILQGKDQPPLNLLIESGAILILALSCLVITYRPNRMQSEKANDPSTARPASTSKS